MCSSADRDVQQSIAVSLLALLPIVSGASIPSKFARGIGFSAGVDLAGVDLSVSVGDTAASTFWLEDIKKQGVAAFNPSPSTYTVFRNVKDYGATGLSHRLFWNCC
jgi:glucan 1,3-beta-glucosidase